MSQTTKRAATGIAIALATSLTAGCSMVETRPDGSQRIIGLVYLETAGEADPAGRHTRLRTLGLSFSTAPQGFTTTIGYSDSAVTLVNENSCVALTRP